MSSILIPLCDLQAQYLSIKEEIDEAISRVLTKGNYVMGEEVEAFEEEWAYYCEMKYCVAVGSGTDALYLTLHATGSNRGVVTTPFTFYAITQAIIASGGMPRFIDVDSCTGNLPDGNYQGDIVVPVHMYGRPGAWRGTCCIEDMSQSHGVKPNPKSVAACFSFYPSKNLGAMGQAGAVVINDRNLADNIRSLRVYGEKERFIYYSKTGNHRMDELQAAILRAKLPHLNYWNERRREIADLYRDILVGDHSVRHIIIKNKQIALPLDTYNHVYHIFALQCSYRDDLAQYLKSQGIQTSIRYPVPVHLQPALMYFDLGYKPGDFPNAERWANTNLSLPIYPEMTDSQVLQVCEAIKKWLKK